MHPTADTTSPLSGDEKTNDLTPAADSATLKCEADTQVDDAVDAQPDNQRETAEPRDAEKSDAAEPESLLEPAPDADFSESDEQSDEPSAEDNPRRARNQLNEQSRFYLALAKKIELFAAGRRDDIIVRDTGLSPWRFYQIIDTLLDHPGALEAEPQFVGRKRRLRERAAN